MRCVEKEKDWMEHCYNISLPRGSSVLLLFHYGSCLHSDINLVFEKKSRFLDSKNLEILSWLLILSKTYLIGNEWNQVTTNGVY